MGLFSFGKKDDAPRRRGGNARSERVERRTRRTERTAGDADAMLLDPTLPEKQRARRRLVGAIALVIAAVVILPMVLDSHPKPVTDDIAIDIPNRPATVPSRASDDRPAAADTPAVPPERGSTGDDAPEAVAQGVSPPPAPASSAAKADKPGKAKPDTPVAQASSSQASKPQAAATRTQSGKPAAANASASDPGSPSAPSGARFAVQLGAFADESNARRWETKLKAAGVPAYIEHRKQADGSTRALLRAGPFPDRAAASAAIAKVREAGLTANAGQ